MFTVKATYRNETRKFSYSASTRFPSYDDLHQQLCRVFPIHHPYYFSKLIFSPDASQPSRLLIGREVHSADEYNTCVAPMLHLSWSNALLRFTVYAETPDKASSVTSGPVEHSVKPVSEFYFSGTPATAVSNKTPSPNGPYHYISSALSPSHVPPPPIIFPSPRQSIQFPSPPLPFVDKSVTISSHASSQQNGSIYCNTKMQSPASHDCSASQGKAEIQALLSSFKEDLDQLLSNLFGSAHDAGSEHINKGGEIETKVESNLSENEDRSMASPVHEEQGPASPEPPKWCFVCRAQFNGPWYGCIKCPWHSVCVTCIDKSGPTHTSSFGPSHVVERHASSRATLPNAPPNIPSDVNAGGDSRVTDVPPSIHRGVMCDNCNEIIVGIRHKCLDCEDYDLCGVCMGSGTAGRHNPFHEFFDIATPGRVFVHTVFNRGPPNDGSVNNAEPHSSLRRENERDIGAGHILHNATCNLCDSPIEGDRYISTLVTIRDYLAFEYYNESTWLKTVLRRITHEQHPNHGFVKVEKPENLMMRNALSVSSTKHYATCNACKQRICGVRYKCMHTNCPDFDLCASCEALPIPVHPAIHPLLKMKTVDTVIPTVYRFGQKSLIEQYGGEMAFSDLPTRNSSHCDRSRSSSASFGTPKVDTRDIVASLSPGPDGLQHYAHTAQVSDTGKPVEVFESRIHTPLAVLTSQIISRNGCEMSVGKEEEEPPYPAFKSPLVRPSSCSAHSSEDQVAHSVLMPSQSPPAEESNLPAHLPDSSYDTFHESWPGFSRGIKHLTRSHSSSSKAQESLVELSLGTGFTRPHGSGSVGDLVAPSLFEPDVQMVQMSPSVVTSAPRSPSISTCLAASTYAAPVNVEEEAQSNQKMTPQIPSTYPRLNSAFLADTTVPDGQIFPPGAEFVKSWRLLNNGDNAWPETTEIQFLAGESFAHDSEQLAKVGKVDPGEEIDVWTGELKAPEVAGRYVSYWRLSDGQGNLFGGSIWVDVTVVEHNNVEEASEDSLASSSIIMPAYASSAVIDHLSHRKAFSVELASLATSKPATNEALSDDGSSFSLISNSPSDHGDLSVWQDSPLYVEVPTPESATPAEYVVLYDSSSSEED
ncbi:hypothetical protein SERLADRAFT_442372 [Serpula lacrymans var. lacrymans S7.9]|uniref:ZZ-type domain-containing protein n=1 Tax=Serpula lacrymans var. lacrymans (strain S7.9) TaxID=578457 RepID=F8P9A7_SERL9|nr:uncharacterized protein SERLADRAFT_442372 [Serpula lacrymans var. lacrymans S7.9]EGO20236.1 hypothetical protein SERLADRAFT_442372 [Serpula lacrymans var. lacrymans S7.9]